MLLIVCHPSSGSTELCLTEIALGGSQIFFLCLVGVWQRNFEPVVCVHGTTGWELVLPVLFFIYPFLITRGLSRDSNQSVIYTYAPPFLFLPLPTGR